MVDHRRLGPGDRDRERLAIGRPEFDDVGAAVLRAADHDSVLAGDGHRQSVMPADLLGRFKHREPRAVAGHRGPCAAGHHEFWRVVIVATCLHTNVHERSLNFQIRFR
jgi:hypothetical protein